MSSQVPMEYQMLQKKLGREMAKEVGDDLISLLIVGSSANFKVFPGVSDVNFVVVLKNPSDLSDTPYAVISKVTELFKEYLDNPMFTTLVDYEIYFEQQMPKGKKLNAFSPLKALALKQGIASDRKMKFNADLNPYKDIEVATDDVKADALKLVKDQLNQLYATLSNPDFSIEGEDSGYAEDMDLQKEYLSIEATLLATQAYYMTKNGAYVDKVDLAYESETNPVEGIDSKFLNIITVKRQGADYATSDLECDCDEYDENGVLIHAPNCKLDPELRELASAKKSGVLNKFDNIVESTINYLASINTLIAEL